MVSPFSSKPFFRRLDRLLTAMAYAEAGDLDAVKALLEQEQTPAAAPEARPRRSLEGAKILEFRRARAAP